MTTPAIDPTWDENFEKILRGYLPFLAPTDPLQADALLRDFGLDSISTITLLADLEDRLHVRFSPEALDLANFETAGKLWATIQEQR